MSDGRAEALLRSALEKIVYFEAHSEQLQGDATTLRAEADQLRAELAAASGREVELRRRVAELEVEMARAHRERGEAARVLDAMRAERDGLMGKVLEAARIQGAAAHGWPGLRPRRVHLRAALGGHRAESGRRAAPTPDSTDSSVDALPRAAPRGCRPGAGDGGPARRRLLLDSGAACRRRRSGPDRDWPRPRRCVRSGGRGDASRRAGRRRRARPSGSSSRAGSTIPAVPRFSEESLFGFSVRELSSPDPSARVRAAERLRVLGERAAAPALAVALHAEREPTVLIALLDCLPRAGVPRGNGGGGPAPRVARLRGAHRRAAGHHHPRPGHRRRRIWRGRARRRSPRCAVGPRCSR